MTTFGFIHAAMHGGWCWDRLAPRLEWSGPGAWSRHPIYQSTAKTGPLAAISLKSYVDQVIAVLKTQPEPAILVGRSLAGPIITQVAGR